MIDIYRDMKCSLSAKKTWFATLQLQHICTRYMIYIADKILFFFFPGQNTILKESGLKFQGPWNIQNKEAISKRQIKFENLFLREKYAFIRHHFFHAI